MPVGRDQGIVASQQLKLLKRQLAYCYRHVPFYRERLDELSMRPEQVTSLDDLQKLPIISKSDVRADISAFLSDDFDADHCHSSFSSGTTGEPFATYFDSRSWYRKRLYNKLRARANCGMYPWQRTAIIDVDDPATLMRKNRLARLGRPLLNVRVLSIFTAMDELVAELQAFRPQNIYGYPSHLLQLATFVRQQGAQVSGIGQIFTSSEYLAGGARSIIESALDAPIYDIYGSTEFKEIAWQCPQRGGYHLNYAEVICEIIEHDRPQHVGDIGDIVVTDLRNRALPLLRFRIGDRGREVTGRCACGRVHPTIAPVSGRKSDFLSLPDGSQLSGYKLTTIVEKCAGLIHYQFVQEAERRLVVNSVWEQQPAAAILEQLRRDVDRVTGHLFSVEVSVLPSIPVDGGSKHKVIVNRTLAV